MNILLTLLLSVGCVSACNASDLRERFLDPVSPSISSSASVEPGMAPPPTSCSQSLEKGICSLVTKASKGPECLRGSKLGQCVYGGTVGAICCCDDVRDPNYGYRQCGRIVTCTACLAFNVGCAISTGTKAARLQKLIYDGYPQADYKRLAWRCLAHGLGACINILALIGCGRCPRCPPERTEYSEQEEEDSPDGVYSLEDGGDAMDGEVVYSLGDDEDDAAGHL